MKTLNQAGFKHAKALIAQGKISDGPWTFAASDKAKLLGPGKPDWANYSQYFLSTDPEATSKTEAYYGYPYGKDGLVYVHALDAIRTRSAQNKEEDIFKAAGELIAMIESKAKPVKRDQEAGQVEIREIELRLEDPEAPGDGSIGKFSGTVEFDTLSRDLGGFTEKIDPQAFDQSLQNDDIRALYMHDRSKPLASTSAGTLTFKKAGGALHFTGLLPDTSYARDLRALNNDHRKELRGSSFGFQVKRQTWAQGSGGLPVRTVHEAKLLEVSPVGDPAYPTNQLNVREFLPEPETKPETEPVAEPAPATLPRATAERILRIKEIDMQNVSVI